MRRAVFVSLIVSLVAWGACKDREPPRADNISMVTETPLEVEEKPDQVDPNTCFGEPTDEEPEFDLALDITRDGERMNFVITLAEKKGLRVCGIRLHITHQGLILNEETGQWEPSSEEAFVIVPRLNPGEVLERVTRLNTGEFRSVIDDPGPLEDWTIAVNSVNDVRKP